MALMCIVIRFQFENCIGVVHAQCQKKNKKKKNYYYILQS